MNYLYILISISIFAILNQALPIYAYLRYPDRMVPPRNILWPSITIVIANIVIITLAWQLLS